MCITFYDIPYSKPNASWSPNTLKTKYALNFKGVEYKTEWVEYPDIADFLKKLGAEPTDGGYTLPVIKDDSTGAIVSDSFKIAQYLDKTYPDLPKLFPNNTEALQTTFQPTFGEAVGSWYTVLIPASHPLLNQKSQGYFRRTRETLFGDKLENLSPQGPVRQEQIKAISKSLGVLDGWYSLVPGPYLLGETPSYADLTVVSYLKWFVIVLPHEWSSDIVPLHNGRWAKLVEAFEKYYP